MDVVSIESAIVEAIESPSVSVIGLVGRWGVGKTHLWKVLVNEQRLVIAPNFPKYAYLSLFGLRSISDVKTSILANITSTADGGTTTLDVAPQGIFSLARVIDSITVVKQLSHSVLYPERALYPYLVRCRLQLPAWHFESSRGSQGPFRSD